MMKSDIQGLAVNTFSDEEITAVNHFNHELVSSGKEIDKILAAAENYSGCYLIQCLAASFHLFFQEPEHYTQANQFLLRANKANKNPNHREKLYFEAIKSWASLDYHKAINHFVAITQQYPQDCSAVKFAEWLFYCTGQKYQSKNFLAMCEPLYPYQKNNNYFLASYAFAQELSGHFDDALRTGNQALEIDSNTAWAHHAISHIQLLEGQIESGIKFMEQHKPSWQKSIPPLCAHNHWHLALLYLANLQFDKVEQLFHDDIWINYPEANWQQIEAISLLWRMEMAGKRQDRYWKEIANYLGKHPFHHDMPFNNMHFLYALTRHNQIYEAREAIDKLALDIKLLPKSSQYAWHEIGLPLLEGVVAFAREDYTGACKRLSAAMKDIYVIGGSDAQCEIAIQTYYLSLLKSGAKQEAKTIYQRYLSHYQGTNLEQYWEGSL
jgi:hypothetical protein